MDSNVISDLSEQTSQWNLLRKDLFERLLNELFAQYVSECGCVDMTRKDGHLLDSSQVDKVKSALPPSELPSTNSLDALYRYIAHISKSISKPKLVHKTLTEAGLNSSLTELFVTLWKGYAPLVVDRLKSASFDHSCTQLHDVHWKVKLLSDQSSDCQQILPLAEIDLFFQDNQTHSSNLSLTFAHQEMMELYENLEAIQSTIDQLHQ